MRYTLIVQEGKRSCDVSDDTSCFQFIKMLATLDAVQQSSCDKHSDSTQTARSTYVNANLQTCQESNQGDMRFKMSQVHYISASQPVEREAFQNPIKFYCI